MNQTAAIALGLAYIVGLLMANFTWGGYFLLGVGIAMAILTTIWQYKLRRRLSDQLTSTTNRSLRQARQKKSDPDRRSIPRPPIPRTLWLLAGLIGFLATLYFQLQTPQPGPNDISRLIVSGGNAENLVMTVWGRVISSPRVTRSGNVQFWLQANLVNQITSNDQNSPVQVNKTVTGKLYVTVPILQATGLQGNETVSVTGTLYAPKPPLNPGSFDFKAYLARQGGFAGMYGRHLSINTTPSWGLSRVRQRIVRAQVQGLDVTKGTLLSAMVLGRRAVDISPEISDRFVRVGLAHTLAASGFHVSLLLGVVLALTARWSPKLRFVFGAIILLLYVGLTGGSASVLRAALMGLAALVGFVMNRQVRPLAVLLAVAVFLLLWNPLLIQDLGFQFSFLATLGLLVTVPPLMRSLQWLPPVIASCIAVPIAAAIWILPLQIYVFNLVSPFSIFVNILAVPFITVITLGGMLTAVVALIWPWAASVLVSGLYYPLQGLIYIVEFFNNLPGNSIAVGTLSLAQLIGLYSINIWLCLSPIIRPAKASQTDHNKRTRINARFYQVLAGILMAIAIITLPMAYAQFTQFRVTVLATAEKPILVVEDRDRVLLVNAGDERTVKFTVLPFLLRQGINQIDWAILTHPQLGLTIGFPHILDTLPIQKFYDTPASKNAYQVSAQAIQNKIVTAQGEYLTLPVQQNLDLGETQVKLINPDVPLVEFIMSDRRWLLMGNIPKEQQSQLLQQHDLSAVDVLWWLGNDLDSQLLDTLKPQVAIATTHTLSPETSQMLENLNIQLFWTGRDGALHWTPQQGFSPTITADQTVDSFF
ncbi:MULTISPECIES: ComEC/Rec2 family competence protein [Oscillatoriales]|uniref:ComEC/Rec2 family competence protein n=1 Tax=Oscillatoriales TaxID=1150 RepID=UPI0002920A25|nr:competence protein [Arthrospira platensis str. Paraca]MDT9310821.1 ComEC/Rec2 family competence protein [Limnospira sp. Paracas R14]